MVVVHPYEVPIHVQHLHHLVRETFVGGQVPLPVDFAVPTLRRRRHGQDVVHERPQELLAEALIVLVFQFGAQKHGNAVESRGEVRGDRILLEKLHLRAQAPEEEHLLHRRAAQDAPGGLPIDGVGVFLEQPAVPARRVALGIVPHLERQRVAHDDHPLGFVNGLATLLLRLRAHRRKPGLHPRAITGVHQLLQVVHGGARRPPHGWRMVTGHRKSFAFFLLVALALRPSGPGRGSTDP
mmetsp:Transcript_18044/g.44695  ORF Transcript_18044/g.44695 Transcript_18044/m.44695 type:complete len:239 (-) Transcript_18044:93-809(-)